MGVWYSLQLSDIFKLVIAETQGSEGSEALYSFEIADIVMRQIKSGN